jgi:hypothetical protein
MPAPHHLPTSHRRTTAPASAPAVCRRVLAIALVASTLFFGSVAPGAAQPLQCSDENPNLWGLRFNFGQAISIAGCQAQCRQGGGNGYACVSAVTGMCLCGTSAKPQSTNPDVPDACNVTCRGSSDLCGGAPSRYSCYAAPPSGPCPSSPRSGCNAAAGTLRLQTRPYDQEYLRWWWARGNVAASDFGDPTASTGYAVCVYADDALIATEEIEAGTGWKRSATGVLRFNDKQGNADGITRVVLRPDEKRASIFVGGRGALLDLPSPPLAYDTSVKVQLARKDAKACWETTLSAPARRNTNGRFLDTK